MTEEYRTPSKTDEHGLSGQNLLWSRDYHVPENSIIVRREVPIDVQNEDRFTPRNTFAFSPLAQYLFSYDNGVLAGLLYLMARKNPQTLERLATNYMDNITKILVAVISTSKAHPLTALNATTQFTCLAHRFGLLDDGHYLKMADQTRSIIDKLIQLNFVDIGMDGLTALVESAQAPGTQPGVAAGKGLGILANLKALK